MCVTASARFAEGCRTYTQRLECYVARLARTIRLLEVARHAPMPDSHVGLGRDIIKDILTPHPRARFGRIGLGKLKGIAIGRGHRYLSVLVD